MKPVGSPPVMVPEPPRGAIRTLTRHDLLQASRGAGLAGKLLPPPPSPPRAWLSCPAPWPGLAQVGCGQVGGGPVLPSSPWGCPEGMSPLLGS